MPGHMFLAQGDLTALACDAWVLPTDVIGEVTDAWPRADAALKGLVPKLRGRTKELRSERATVLGQARPDGPIIVAADTGGTGSQSAPWFGKGLRAALDLAVANLDGAPRHGRARRLVGLPFVGIHGGGAGDIKGDVLREILEVAYDVLQAYDTTDIAFVTIRRRYLAAAQEARRQLDTDLGSTWWADLDESDLAVARRLADLASRRQLVFFLGAGVSMGAGLPGWDDLLVTLTRDTTIEAASKEFQQLDVLDQARVIRRRLGDEEYTRRMRNVFNVREQALAHQLLASLPVHEAATTNYDTLFERAWSQVEPRVAVLPGSPTVDASRWLLKMHGTIEKPESLVLCRDDYLRFDRERTALAGIVQAMLLTRHMLFVGFSLDDDHFHRIVHEVRGAMGGREGTPADRRFGTALSPAGGAFAKELWGGDLDIVDLSRGEDVAQGARRVEILLDRVLADAHLPGGHLLDHSFDALWNDDERQLRSALENVQATLKLPGIGPVRHTVERLLQDLGAEGGSDAHKWES